MLFLWLSKSSRGFGDLALQKSLGVLKNRKILENLDGNTVRIQEIGDFSQFVNLPNLLALLSIRGIFVQIMEINSSHAIRKDVAAMTV